MKHSSTKSARRSQTQHTRSSSENDRTVCYWFLNSWQQNKHLCAKQRKDDSVTSLDVAKLDISSVGNTSLAPNISKHLPVTQHKSYTECLCVCVPSMCIHGQPKPVVLRSPTDVRSIPGSTIDISEPALMSCDLAMPTHSSCVLPVFAKYIIIPWKQAIRESASRYRSYAPPSLEVKRAIKRGEPVRIHPNMHVLFSRNLYKYW